MKGSKGIRARQLGVVLMACALGLLPASMGRAQGIGSAVSSEFELYLGPDFVRPAPNGVASAVSPTFDLWLGQLSESFALSATFSLDARMSAAVVGTIRAAAGGASVAGATVELYLGSNRQQATTTDGEGHYEFFATLKGDYVLRVSKIGYSMSTSDLLRFLGSTLTADLSLSGGPPAGQTLPDLVIGPTDLTYTPVTSGTLTLTAMVHNSGAATVSNVRVRFYDASTGSGVNDFVRITPDVVIASLAPGEAKPASVTWTPPSGHQRFYAFADPDGQVVEATALNNGNAKDLGVYSGEKPRVSVVTARYTGIQDPHVMGQFLSRFEGCINWFTAQVTAPKDDISEVTFDFGGTVVRDTDGSNGWCVPFDVGTLPPGNVMLHVKAKTAAGLWSEAYPVTIVMHDWPWWLNGKVVPSGLPVDFSAGYSKGYLELAFDFSKDEEHSSSWVDFTDILSPDILIVGGARSVFSLKGSLQLSVPLVPGLPWKAGGAVERSESVFDSELNSTSMAFEVALTPDGQQLESATIGPFEHQVQIASSPEITSPPLTFYGISTTVGLSMDAFLKAAVEGTLAGNLSSYSVRLTPQVVVDINGTLRISDLVKFSKLELILSPRVAFGPQLQYACCPGDLSVSGSFDEEIGGRIVGSVIWGVVRKDLVSWTWGPWHQDYPKGQPALARMVGDALASDSVVVPEVFPYPVAAASPSGKVGVVWVSDVSGDPGRIDPELFFAERDSSGWGASARITTNDRFETTPTLAYLPDGRPLAVWIQSSILESDADPSLTLSQVLDRQDVWYSVRTNGTWCQPAPIIADSLLPYRADGLPALTGTADGAQVAWTRSIGDSALAPGSGEIFVSRFSGGTWSEPMRLTVDEVDDAAPAICMAGGDSTVVAWLREDPAGAGFKAIEWSVLGGVSQSPARQLNCAGGRRQDLTLAYGSNGKLVASWVELETMPDSTMSYHLKAAVKALSDTSWGAPQEVTTDSHLIETPVVMVDQRGIVAILWRGYAGMNGGLKLALIDLNNPAVGWTQPRAITEDSLTNWMATAAVDGQNNLHVVNLKSDLSDTTGTQRSGNFFGGLSVASRGITRDLDVSDQLNFGYRPMSCDLRLGAGAVSVGSAQAVVGDTVQVQCRVENIGDVRSATTAVRFYDGPPDSGGVALPGGDVPLGAISPDSSLSVGAPWVVAAGTHRLCAVADPVGTLPEQTKSNNRAFVMVEVFPDLVVDSVQVADDNPPAGATDSITAWVRNAGPAAAGDFSVRFTGRPGVLATVGGISLAPGRDTSVTVSFLVQPGVDTLVAVADPDGATGDPNRANNLANAVLRVLPDLALNPDSIAYIAQDTSGVLSAVVRNLGATRCDSSTVAFYRGNPLAGGTLLDSVRVDTLGAFGAARVTIPWRASLGASTVYVVADPSGLIAERDRGNNETYADVVTSALSDLVAVPGSIEVQVAAGPTFTLSARITNAGAAHSLAVGVEFFRGDPDSGGTLIGDRLLAVVPMGETTTVAVPWASPDPVENPIFVVVDRANAIPELAEGNNRISRNFGAVVDVPPVRLLPLQLALHSARPNPFASRTAIHFDLPVGGRVRLVIFDVAGRRVRTLVDGVLAPGFHVSEWDGRGDGGGLRAGVYFARLEAPGGTLSRKLVRLD